MSKCNKDINEMLFWVYMVVLTVAISVMPMGEDVEKTDCVEKCVQNGNSVEVCEEMMRSD